MYDLESALIGGLITNSDKFVEIDGIISVTDLNNESARKVFECSYDFFRKGKPVNIQTVSLAVGRDHAKWLNNAYDDGFPQNVKYIADKIKEKQQTEKVSVFLKTALQEIKDFGPQQILKDMANFYMDQATKERTGGHITKIIKGFKKIVSSEQGYGCRSHIPKLEDNHIKFIPGHLWVVGGWTSVGKTAIMVEMIKRQINFQNPAITIISTEMTKNQLIARIISNKSGLNSNLIMDGQHKNNPKLHESMNWIESKNLTIIDHLRDLGDIQTECRKIKMQKGINLIFFDFIQNIKKKGANSKYEMTSDVAHAMQDLPKELDCTSICLSQIPNSAAKDDAGILEFKGAGEIAAACDVGILLTKAKEYNGRGLICNMRKNRHGQRVDFTMVFSEKWTSLEDVI